MPTRIDSTLACLPEERTGYWNRVVSEAYFPLCLSFRREASFAGELRRTPMGAVGLSRLISEPVHYERRRHQISDAQQGEYLITIPQRSPVEFVQFGREVSCEPGGFIIQRGDAPYRFMYANRNDLFVIKACETTLMERLRDPDRFCARPIGAGDGIGKLFVSMVAGAFEQADGTTARGADVLGRHLVDLLTLTLEGGPDPSLSTVSSVRAAHIARIEAFIRRNLTNLDLSPSLVADACGISKRYLHGLFTDRNATVSQFIRDERLEAARESLAMSDGRAISEIAYRFCFADHAQFSRLFRNRFGETPSDYRARH